MKNYRIFRNLKRDVYYVEIKNSKKWKKVLETSALTAFNCVFKVNEKGRQKTIADNKRNVHAYCYAESFVEKLPDQWSFDYDPIHYNPFVNKQFEKDIFNTVVKKASEVVFDGKQVFVKNK